MKDLLLFLVLLFFVYTPVGQDSGSSDEPPIHKIEQLELVNLPQLNKSAGTSISLGDTSQNSTRWSVQFRLKNLTPKTVKKVYWYFKLLDSPEKKLNKVFETKRKIKAQNDSEIAEEFNCNPQLISPQLKFTVEITRIEYEDGSHWEYPAAKPDKE
ncbi:MAG: hypothetical protein AB1489_34150 [Acidobacteriota bacterium]